MKNLLYTFTLLLFTTTAHAQIEKGYGLLGGNAGFSRNSIGSGNNATITSANIGLSYGRVIKDNTINGFSVGFGYGNQPGSVTDPLGVVTNYRTRNYAYSVGVFRRRYLPLGKSFYLFGQAGADLGYNQAEFNRSGPVTPVNILNRKQYSVNAYVFPGLSYQFSRRCLLELSLPPLIAAGFVQTDDPGAPKSSNVYLNSNFNLSSLNNVQVGFRVLLVPKKLRK